MHIAIYSPYLDTLGGGERYIATLAEILSHKNQVDVLLDKHLQSFGNNFLKKNLSEHFNLDLSKVDFIRASIGKRSNFISKYFFLKKYDVLIYLTDGSIFYTTARKNFLHFQVPFESNKNDLWEKIKLSTWNKAFFNSKIGRA